jgi:putative peptidoglycan binding protein
MADRDPRSPDPDDWFADPERTAPRRARQPARAARPRTEGEEEDWIDDGSPARRPGPEFLASLPDPWIKIGAGVLLVLVLLVGWLSLKGVFSSSTPTQAGTTSTQIATTPITPTTTPTTTPAASTLPVPAAPLKPGDTGAQVKQLQRALSQLGYTVGTIDGDYGTATKTAVEQFQTASNLTADGVFGPATRTALIAALKRG